MPVGARPQGIGLPKVDHGGAGVRLLGHLEGPQGFRLVEVPRLQEPLHARHPLCLRTRPRARRRLLIRPSKPSQVSSLVLTIPEHCIKHTAACGMHSGQEAQHLQRVSA